MLVAIERAYTLALVSGSSLEASGAARLPLLQIAHELGDVLARVGPVKPMQDPPDLSTFPVSKVLTSAKKPGKAGGGA
jgi:hypothetical protein